MAKAGTRYFLEAEGGSAKFLRSVVRVVDNLSPDGTKLRPDFCAVTSAIIAIPASI
jgi:hypothetical protein